MKNQARAAGHQKTVSKVALALTALLATAFALALLGCSEGGSGGPATTASGTSVGPSASAAPPSAGISTTTTLPQLLSDWDRELAETAQAQNQLAVHLTEQGAARDDPRLAVIFGLRARTQAITGLQALNGGDLELADMAMKDVYPTLNLGRNLAEGSVSQTLENASTAIATLGVPSDRPEEAAASLQKFIAALRPLLDEARALIPET